MVRLLSQVAQREKTRERERCQPEKVRQRKPASIASERIDRRKELDEL